MKNAYNWFDEEILIHNLQGEIRAFKTDTPNIEIIDIMPYSDSEISVIFKTDYHPPVTRKQEFLNNISGGRISLPTEYTDTRIIVMG
ncbi:hypothetical protein N9J72_00950 [Candidatus Gracilibacteria bacterium]|nr:hypothetical protein [Candidatus Gracilibacteria bacterium]